MKERPIIFSGPMVRAIIDGRKTQTRRIVKPQPDSEHDGEPYWFVGGYRAWRWRGVTDILRIGGNEIMCPYGQPGDRLWVRETHYVWSAGNKDGTGLRIDYRATEPDAPCTWTPSIYMPRWASRITLEITGVRVEQLQEISISDAEAEGVEWDRGRSHHSRKESFAVLWNSINANRYPWLNNPWVWVIEFKRIEADHGKA